MGVIYYAVHDERRVYARLGKGIWMNPEGWRLLDDLIELDELIDLKAVYSPVSEEEEAALVERACLIGRGERPISIDLPLAEEAYVVGDLDVGWHTIVFTDCVARVSCAKAGVGRVECIWSFDAVLRAMHLPSECDDPRTAALDALAEVSSPIRPVEG